MKNAVTAKLAPCLEKIEVVEIGVAAVELHLKRLKEMANFGGTILYLSRLTKVLKILMCSL